MKSFAKYIQVKRPDEMALCQRILAMLLLLYDSTAKVQELCDLKVCDVRIDTPPAVHLFGKGRKNREVPFTELCAKVLRRFLCTGQIHLPGK